LGHKTYPSPRSLPVSQRACARAEGARHQSAESSGTALRLIRSEAETFALINQLLAKARELELQSAASPIVQGRHLIALGLKPEPEFKPILDAAFEALLDGALRDEKNFTNWLKQLTTGAPGLG